MPADINTGHVVVHQEEVAGGDQVDVSWTLTNSGEQDTTGKESIHFQVQGPDHAPVHDKQIPMSTKVHAGADQHYNYSFNAPDEAGEYEVFVYPDPPHGGSGRGAFTVKGYS